VKIPLVFVVEPDAAILQEVRNILRGQARTRGFGDFLTARTALYDEPPDFLVSNVRLGFYNGLHLVHLAAASHMKTRAIMYAPLRDTVLAREAASVGAFFERQAHLLYVLPAYITQKRLPARDRRIASGDDRRLLNRGGRRIVDRVGRTPAPIERHA
jgi:DNA-binding NtrC family response regulator